MWYINLLNFFIQWLNCNVLTVLKLSGDDLEHIFITFNEKQTCMAVDDTQTSNRIFYRVVKKATTLRVLFIVNKVGSTIKVRSHSWWIKYNVFKEQNLNS